MKWTSLIALSGVLALSAGCVVQTKTAAPAKAPEKEPIVVVQTPESGMLPGAQEWDWTPPEQKTVRTTEGQMMPTNLSAQKTSMGHHLKKRTPKKDNKEQ